MPWAAKQFSVGIFHVLVHYSKNSVNSGITRYVWYFLKLDKTRLFGTRYFLFGYIPNLEYTKTRKSQYLVLLGMIIRFRYRFRYSIVFAFGCTPTYIVLFCNCTYVGQKPKSLTTLGQQLSAGMAHSREVGKTYKKLIHTKSTFLE